MIDGTYKIKVDVPFGRKEGMVTLRVEGEVVHADIDAPIIGKRRATGRADGDTFTAQGSGKVKLLGAIEYTLKGKVVGNSLQVDVQSNKGAFKLEGARV